MTTRKRKPAFARLAGLVLAAMLGGCATPGPLHVYALSPSGERPVVDSLGTETHEVPSFLADDEKITGFAYDPFTDHFFLRLDPGNKIRVVDRPDRSIKREFEIEGITTPSAGDLTLRPRDGHLFLLGAEPGSVIETTRLGKLVRTFLLAGVREAPIGIAFDPIRDRLFVLAADGRRISVHDLQGADVGTFSLTQRAGASLAFDAERKELYAPLAERADEIGVFDETGKLLRTVAGAGALIDVGPRSFVRVF